MEGCRNYIYINAIDADWNDATFGQQKKLLVFKQIILSWRKKGNCEPYMDVELWHGINLIFLF